MPQWVHYYDTDHLSDSYLSRDSYTNAPPDTLAILRDLEQKDDSPRVRFYASLCLLSQDRNYGPGLLVKNLELLPDIERAKGLVNTVLQSRKYYLNKRHAVRIKRHGSI